MTAHDPSRDGPADRTAKFVPGAPSSGDARGGGGPAQGMQSGTGRLENPEAALGGADAVEKTSAVVGRGTDPQAQRGDAPAAAELPSGRGPNLVAWGVAAIAGIILLVYLLGLMG